ncbi:MAG: 30S ribosomal protein S3 [Deferribacterota bacterium]|nr:30S ribosomal protein S3 [Deferribacterota bacterium]
MGQKVNPHGFRLGIIKPWKSQWYASKKDYRKKLAEDDKIRKFLKKEYYDAGISSIDIERMGEKVRITLNTSRPGVLIGKKGSNIEEIKDRLKAYTDSVVLIVIREVKRPELDSQLVAENIAAQIRRRVPFRRAMKRAVFQATKGGALGIKVACSGRLGGAEMSRTEWYIKGRMPLQTIRADIDYGVADSFTTYGIIGVKVWIFKGERIEDTSKIKREVEASVNA